MEFIQTSPEFQTFETLESLDTTICRTFFNVFAGRRSTYKKSELRKFILFPFNKNVEPVCIKGNKSFHNIGPGELSYVVKRQKGFMR